jgi:hypothetical protein
MEMSQWIGQRWFDLLQSVGIIGGLLFTAYAVRKDEKGRRILNLIYINEQYGNIWHEFYERPQLSRVLKKDVDLNKEPVSNEEMLFVKMLILHLDTVRRATKVGVFVKIQGLQRDVRELFTLPIPKAVWEKIKPFQDGDFVVFVENCLAGKRINRKTPLGILR